MRITRYTTELARMQFKGPRSKIWVLNPNSKINGYRIYARKHCVEISVPKGDKYAFGLPEADYFGHEGLVLVTAKHVNPAIFGRE